MVQLEQRLAYFQEMRRRAEGMVASLAPVAEAEASLNAIDAESQPSSSASVHKQVFEPHPTPVLAPGIPF